MYRVYCFLGPYRYYYSRGYWSTWSRGATPLTLAEAEEIATRERGTVEPILGETMQSLIEAIETAKRDIQVELKDLAKPDDLVRMLDGLDRVFLLAPYSPTETREVAKRVMLVLQYCTNCVNSAENEDLHKRLVRIGVNFCNEFNDWYNKASRKERESRKDWHDPTIKPSRTGRWESRGGKYWVELCRGPFDYYYRSNNSSGSIGHPNMPEVGAVAVIQSMLDRGQFLPTR